MNDQTDGIEEVRPRSSMSWSWRREAPMLAIVLGMFVASSAAWSRVETPIPIHWNASGEVDGYGGRFEGLLLIPLIALGIYGLLLVLPKADPARANYESFVGAYGWIRLGVTAFLGLIHGFVVATALGAGIDLFLVFPLAMGALFLLLGNVMGKIRPNFFAGIRTPWTLASTKSWNATHRRGGWVFVATGIGFLLIAVIREPWFLWAVMGGLGVGIAWLTFTSWQVWRSDADRVPVTGTRPADPSEDGPSRGS